jgi:hypothetical protein
MENIQVPKETRTSGYNKDSVDKAIKADPTIKGKEGRAIHGLLKGRKATTPKSEFKPKTKVSESKDIVDFSMFAGMYSDGGRAYYTDEDGNRHVITGTGGSPRKYQLDGQDISWDELKRKVGNRKFASFHQGITESRRTKLKEGVLDDQDDDGFMAKRQLYDIAKYAVELHRSIQDTDNLEPWIQAKITTAAEYIDTVKHYMEYNQVRDAGDVADVAGPPDMADIDGIDFQLPDLTQEDTILEYDTDEEGTTLSAWDILDMAVRRGILRPEQTLDPDPSVLQAADSFALDLGTVYEAGSSDISAWMRQFIRQYGDRIAFNGPRAHLYESEIKARQIYQRMTRKLRS